MSVWKDLAFYCTGQGCETKAQIWVTSSSTGGKMQMYFFVPLAIVAGKQMYFWERNHFRKELNRNNHSTNKNKTGLSLSTLKLMWEHRQTTPLLHSSTILWEHENMPPTHKDTRLRWKPRFLEQVSRTSLGAPRSASWLSSIKAMLNSHKVFLLLLNWGL
jgi:hypothetical protein